MSKNRQQDALIRRVLLDLETGKKYRNANICHDDFLQIKYLKAECLNKESCVVLPHLSCQELDLKKIDELHSRVGESRFLVTLCDNSSNILYYHQIQGVSDI